MQTTRWIAVGLLVFFECTQPRSAEAAGRRLRRRAACAPCIPARTLPPCPNPCPPGCPPADCDKECGKIYPALSTFVVFVDCPKKELAKITLGATIVYQMECDRCQREEATPLSPKRCRASGTFARNSSTNSIVADKCDADPVNCVGCTRCVCSNSTSTTLPVSCRCLTSLEAVGIAGAAPPGAAPQLQQGVAFVKGREPKAIRFRTSEEGPMIDAVVYELERDGLVEGLEPGVSARYALGFQVATTADDLPTVFDGVVQFDRCAYRVPFEGTTYQVVVSSAAGRPLPGGG